VRIAAQGTCWRRFALPYIGSPWEVQSGPMRCAFYLPLMIRRKQYPARPVTAAMLNNMKPRAKGSI